MKKYKSIELDYGVNTALIEAYKEMQREMDMENVVDEDIDEIAPVMGTSEDLAAAEEFASELESSGSEIVEIDE